MGRYYCDTIIHNADYFEFGVQIIGIDCILYGTDYPFDMEYLSPAREIPGISRMSEADQEKSCPRMQKRFTDSELAGKKGRALIDYRLCLAGDLSFLRRKAHGEITGLCRPSIVERS